MLTTPARPLTRAYASAAVAAPPEDEIDTQPGERLTDDVSHGGSGRGKGSGRVRGRVAGGGHRSIRARTRLGLPNPPTIGSGAAITTAPVAGRVARFCSWVRPYLPAPRTN